MSWGTVLAAAVGGICLWLGRTAFNWLFNRIFGGFIDRAEERARQRRDKKAADYAADFKRREEEFEQSLKK